MYSGREIDDATHGLVIAKDVLVATSVASGVASTAAGYFGMREPATGEPVAVDVEGEAMADDRRVKIAEKITGIAGVVNLVSLAGVVGITAVLAMKAGQSSKWSMFSRAAP